MIRKKQKHTGPIVIDLTGPDGNAFVLLAHAKSLSKQLNMQYGPIADDMMSGDYENLLEVFDKHFGEFVILER